MVARKIALNTIISAGFRIVGTLIALVIIGLITRHLSRSEWGEYSIVLTFGGIFAVLADWGFYQLMVREISKPGADEKKIASNIFTLKLLSSFFVFALAPLIGLLFPYSEQTKLAILFGMLGFWALSGSQVLMGVFQKYLRMDRAGVAELSGRIVQLAMVYLFIKFDLGLLWFVGALVASSIVNSLVVLRLARKYVAVGLAFDFTFWKKSLIQSLPLAVANILVMIYFSTDSLFLSVFKPAADVGVYRLSYKVLESLIFFPSMFVGLVMPLLSKSASHDWPRFKKIFRRSFDALAIFAAPLIGGTFVFSPLIIEILGGGNYPESVPLLNILIVAVGIIFFGTLFSFSLIAIEKQRSLLWISGVGAIFNVTLNIIFIPRYSYWAAAATTVLTEFLVTILMLAVLWRVLRFGPSGLVLIKSVLAAALATAVGMFLKSQNAFVLIALMVAVYFGFLYLIRGFSAADVFALARKDND